MKEACCCPENPDELFAPLVWSVAAGFNSFFHLASASSFLFFAAPSLRPYTLPSFAIYDCEHRFPCEQRPLLAPWAQMEISLAAYQKRTGQLRWDRLSNGLVIVDLHA